MFLFVSHTNALYSPTCLFRSKIRIRDGRAKPIDLLAKYISAEDDDLAVEMHEPYTFLNGLTVTDMDDLLEDIKVGGNPTINSKRVKKLTLVN